LVGVVNLRTQLQTGAESVMHDVISTYPQIDAVFTIGSMGMGALRVFQNAGKPLPAISGDPPPMNLRCSPKSSAITVWISNMPAPRTLRESGGPQAIR
jgi:hypothetical protein